MPSQIESGSPLTGSDVNVLTYADTSELIEETKRAITQCVAMGYKRDMIAVVTFRGREHSMLSGYDKLGPFSLRHFSGNYDIFGNPIFIEGDIAIESVYRFKGQSAPCIILTEIHFDELDDMTIRKLFVGATRATMKLTLIVSNVAAQLLLNKQGET